MDRGKKHEKQSCYIHPALNDSSTNKKYSFVHIQVLLVTLTPQLKVVFTHPLKGNPSTLPLLAWQFVVIQVSESDRVIDPVLAFARESTIYFHQV